MKSIRIIIHRNEDKPFHVLVDGLKKYRCKTHEEAHAMKTLERSKEALNDN